jgi:riboflavin synthase
MFTGIIENMATLIEVVQNQSNKTFWLESTIAHEFKVDQSVAHNGVCLTVEAVQHNRYQVTAVAETLQKTSLGSLQIGDKVNLERCLKVGDRLDGHFVSGHVDGTAVCTSLQDEGGSWLYQFQVQNQFSSLMIEKGSITINGTSLTIFNVTDNSFQVAIIPYTYYHTTMQFVQVGDLVNIEFDLLGKYIQRSLLNK